MAIVLAPFAGSAAGTVTICTEAALDAALAGGDAATFACDGTIVFSATKVVTLATTLDGGGRAVVLDGGGTVRLFRVEGATFEIRALTLQNGHSRGEAACTAPRTTAGRPRRARGPAGRGI